MVLSHLSIANNGLRLLRFLMACLFFIIPAISIAQSNKGNCKQNHYVSQVTIYPPAFKNFPDNRTISIFPKTLWNAVGNAFYDLIMNHRKQLCWSVENAKIGNNVLNHAKSNAEAVEKFYNEHNDKDTDFLLDFIKEMDPSPTVLVYWQKDTLYITKDVVVADFSVFDPRHNSETTQILEFPLTNDRKRVQSLTKNKVYKKLDDIADFIMQDNLGE